MQIMKQTAFILITALITTQIGVTAAPQSQKEIRLESPLLKTVDGNFINADTIEVMRRFQRKLVDIQFGERDKQGNRTGRYEFLGQRCSVHELCRHEMLLTQHKETVSTQEHKKKAAALATLLTKAKDDFVKLGGEFRVVARGAKPIMAALIKESCAKRGRSHSVLVKWADCKEAAEDALFDRYITTLNQYEEFCVDLLNYLGDLVRSCPKANAQFQGRVKKWTKIRELIPKVLPADMRAQEMAFSTYIKKHHLDAMNIGDITLQRMQTIFTAFKAKAKNMLG